MYWIEQRLIGQEPHSGRDLGGDIISNADGSERERERERERDFVSPITHLESICASLAVGRTRLQSSHMWQRVGDTCLTYEREQPQWFTLFGIRHEQERTIVERRWASSVYVCVHARVSHSILKLQKSSAIVLMFNGYRQHGVIVLLRVDLRLCGELCVTNTLKIWHGKPLRYNNMI